MQKSTKVLSFIIPPWLVTDQATGWLRTTVYYHFFLTNVKMPKNGKTQSFFWSLYVDILIFWSLNIVKLKLSCVSELFKIGMTAPHKLQPAGTEFSDSLPNTPEQVRHLRISINVSHTNLDTPLTPPSGLRHQQTAADITRHWQTLPNTPELCLGVFEGVWLVSVGVCWCLLVSGMCRGVWRGIWVIFWHYWGAQIHSEVCLKAQS